MSKSEASAYEFFGLPLPVICPEERIRRRLAFTNERRFFWRTCDATGRKIFSAYGSSASFPVVSLGYALENDWDNLSYGRDFDFNKAFFEQLFELWKAVPRPACSGKYYSNAMAVHDSMFAKNCFFVSQAHSVENSFYSVGLWDCADCCDCLSVSDSRLCYECVNCRYSEYLKWCESCIDCSHSSFLLNCSNCSNCLFCSNLEGKRHHVFNREVAPEEYSQTLNQWNFLNRHIVEAGKERFHEFISDSCSPHIYSDNPSVCSGNYLYGCENVIDSFCCGQSGDLIHCSSLIRARNCLDGSRFGCGLENAAQFVDVGLNATDIINCVDCCNNVSNLVYCFHCEESSHLLGCIGLRKREYCILNRQYSKSQYFEVRSAIEEDMREDGVWGLFFPIPFSSYAYNQSAAQDYMPLSEAQAGVMNFFWEKGADVVKPSQLLGEELGSPSERFAEVPVDLQSLERGRLKDLLFLCEITCQPYQLDPGEVELYERFGAAPPARSFEQRHKERIVKFAPMALQTRKSSLSKRQFRTCFPENWMRPVVEHSEWQNEVAANSRK